MVRGLQAAMSGRSDRLESPIPRWRQSITGIEVAFGVYTCHGLMTVAPAASNGLVSRVATARPLAAAMAAM